VVAVELVHVDVVVHVHVSMVHAAEPVVVAAAAVHHLHHAWSRNVRICQHHLLVVVSEVCLFLSSHLLLDVLGVIG